MKNLNVSFVHPDDALQIEQEHQTNFLVQNKTLGIQTLHHAVLAPGGLNGEIGGIWNEKGEHLSSTYVHWMKNTQPPRKLKKE